MLGEGGRNQIVSATINNMKGTPWEKIFANHISNKGLISTLYKEFIQSNSKTPNDTMGKAP